MTRRNHDRDPGALPSGQPWIASEDRDRHRAFEAARRAAMALGKTLAKDDGPDWPRCVADPETVERYRWLLVAMGMARATPGGRAIADLARRGYAIARIRSVGRLHLTPRPLDWVGAAWFGVGLPRRYGRWASMEEDALRVDIAALPQLRFVSAHVTIRIKSELQRASHDLG